MALRFAADEDFDHRILDGLKHSHSELDIQTIQEAGRYGAADPDNLEWAAGHDRVFLTHDISTVPPAAAERIRSSLPMPGLVVVPQLLPVGDAVQTLSQLITDYPDPEAWENRIEYLRKRPRPRGE